MALSLLYGKRYNQASIGSIELDVTLREEHRFTSRVTTYPVEDGSILSDHIIKEPLQITLEGIVTDSPLQILSLFNRSTETFNRLINLFEERSIVTVVTGIKVYPNMAITSLNVPRDTTTGQSLTFTIELQEVILDTTIRFEYVDQSVFGGVQSKIPEEIVSSGENIPYIQLDPIDSLKDQATSGFDAGTQSLQTIPSDVLVKVDESRDIILGVA